MTYYREKVIFHEQFSSINFLLALLVSMEYNVPPSENIIVPLPPPIGVGVIVGVSVGVIVGMSVGVLVIVGKGVLVELAN